MKRDKFIDNLIRRGGFVQCQNGERRIGLKHTISVAVSQ